MWELDHEEGWMSKNWCFWTVVLEKTLESPLNCKEIQPVNPKGNQHWIFIGRTNVEAEALILWPPDAKSQLSGKDPDAGRMLLVMAEQVFLPMGDICCLVTKSCLTLCNPMDCSTPGFRVLHQLLESAQIHVHWVSGAIQPSHPLPPSSFASRGQNI